MKVVFSQAVLDEWERMGKAFGRKDYSRLHKKRITDKNGHQRDVWVRNEEKPKGKPSGGGEAKGETKPSKHAGSAGASVKGKALSVGDRVSFIKDGMTLEGEVAASGKLGVTVRGEGSAKGVMYQVPHGDIKNVQRLKNPAFIKGGWRGTDGYQPELCDTIAGLMKTVEAVRNEFSELSEGVKKRFASLNPLLLKRSSLKSEKRIKEKLREDAKAKLAEAKKNGISGYVPEEYDEKTDTYHCRTIRDCDGHTLCLNSLEDVEKVAAYYDKQSYVARIKNNFAKPSPVGYSDINMNIKLSNGAIVEMQLNTTANMVAKERYGHSLYEVYRSVESNPQYKDLADLMGEAQKALYGLSNKYSQEGNYPTKEIPSGNIFAAEYKHEPYAAAIRGFVDKAKPLYDKAKSAGVLNEDTVKHFDHLLEYIR